MSFKIIIDAIPNFRKNQVMEVTIILDEANIINIRVAVLYIVK